METEFTPPAGEPDVADETRPTPSEAEVENPNEPVDGADLPASVPDGDASEGDDTDDDEETGS